jgi:hypothetical protein
MDRTALLAALSGLIDQVNDLRRDARDFESIGDERREIHVQSRSRWLADCRTLLRHAGLEDYLGRLEVLVPGTARGPFQFSEVAGLLESAKEAIQHGTATSARVLDFGEILSDLVLLAKEALARADNGSKNVAAVLTAAAFEDTIRRLGDTHAQVTGRPDLSHVIDALKHHGVLKGAALTTALGYLKFRNDALHADWDALDRAVVGSCVAYTEGLLLKHFA